MQRMSESDVRLRLYMCLVSIESANLTADVKRVKKMAGAYLSAPLFDAITLAKVDDRKPKKVTAKTRAEVAATGKDSLVEFFDSLDMDPGMFVQFDLREPSIDVRAVAEAPAVSKRRATALDELTAAFVAAAEVWRGVAYVRWGHIKAEYVGASPPYARLPKPRVSARYPQRSVVTFLDRANEDWAEDVEALLVPPPAHATIAKHGELVEIRWAKTLDDGDVAQASTWHDCWIRRTATEPDKQFNAEGDELVSAGNAKPVAPLTLYNPWWKIGFKAVLVTPDGDLEQSAWEEALAVLRAKALPSGEPVEKLWIVAPLREHALAMHERVVKAGFDGALYPGRRTDFWNPTPKAPWLSQSTDNGAEVQVR